MLPTRAKSVSPAPKRTTYAGHYVPMPLGKPRTSDTTSESELDSSSESDFEELPSPREHAPPLPEGAERQHKTEPIKAPRMECQIPLNPITWNQLI